MAQLVAHMDVRGILRTYQEKLWFPLPNSRAFDYKAIDDFSKKLKSGNGGALINFSCQILFFDRTMLKYEQVVPSWQTSEIMKIGPLVRVSFRFRHRRPRLAPIRA